MTQLVAIAADLHTTGYGALIKPAVKLDNGGTYKASKGERFLWKSWCTHWEKIGNFASKNDLSVTLILNGDALEATAKERSNQIITKNKAKIIEYAFDTLEPALDVCTSVFVIRGTEFHTGQSGEYEELLARDINAEKDGDNYSWWQLYANFDGILFDIEHHGPLGRLPWTLGNALNRLTVELLIGYNKIGSKMPDIAIRSHNHIYATNSDHYATRVISTPAWKLGAHDSYVRRLAKVVPADIGGMYIVCDRGKYERFMDIYKPAPSRPWRKK